MSSGHLQRQRLFDKFSINWKLVRPFLTNTNNIPAGFQDAYECPVCTTIHEETSLTLDARSDNFLTLEDAPPRSLGGRPICLTCRRCNNKAGGTIDKEFKHFHVMNSILLKETGDKMDVNILVGDILKSRGYLMWSMERQRLELKSKINQYGLKKLSENLTNQSIPFKIQFKKPKDRSIHISLLKSAYLLAFANFGYAYIQNRALDKVREQILNHSRQIIHVGVINPRDKTFPVGFYKVCQPAEMQSLLVVFSIKANKTRIEKVGIILPSIFDSEATIYDTLKSNSAVSFQLWKFPEIDYLTDSSHILDPALAWSK